VAITAMLCASPATLGLVMALNDHAPTWFTLSLLGALLVLLEDGCGKAKDLGIAQLVAILAVCGPIVGANAASDQLAATAGCGSFALALGLTALLRPSRNTRRAAAAGVALLAVAGCSAAILHTAVRHLHVVAAADPRVDLLSGGETIGRNVGLWWQGLLLLGNGDFFGEHLGFSSLLALVCAALTLAALGGGLAAARKTIATGARVSNGEPSPAAIAWAAFWATAIIVLSVGFIVSQAPEDLASSRYLVGVIYGAAALLPILGEHGVIKRMLVTAGVIVYGFAGWVGLTQEQIKPLASPTDGLAASIARIARHEHLAVGYAGYWDAAPITWATKFAIDVFPVTDCYGGQHVCRFFLHYMTSWYQPKPGTKSFLLSDPETSVPSTPSNDLGPPSAIHHIGPVTMFVYPYDIASRFAVEVPPS
jgi:hypothetical protein